MYAASRLELLPLELLDLLFEILPFSAVAQLMRTSKALLHLIHPILYSRKDAQNAVMMRAYGYEGAVESLRIAIRHGAPVSKVAWPASQSKSDPSHGRVEAGQHLTLYLALRKHNLSAFGLLLESGACVDDRGVGRWQLAALIKRLCEYQNRPFLDLFVKAGRAADIEKLGSRLLQGANVNSFPVNTAVRRDFPRLVRSAPPIAFLRVLLATGAINVDHAQMLSDGTLLSPLSAALLADTPEVFWLLVSRGASVYGQDHVRLSERPLNIPVFAAAHALAVECGTHGRHAVQMCLDAGASLMRTSHCLERRNGLLASANGIPIGYYFTTPVLIYLDAMQSWEQGLYHARSKAEETEQNTHGAQEVGAMHPTDALGFLFEHGATVVRPKYFGDYFTRHFPGESKPSWREIVWIPSAIDFLFEKWGVEMLKDVNFTSVLALLVRKGAARRCDNPYVGIQKDTDEKGGIGAEDDRPLTKDLETDQTTYKAPEQIDHDVGHLLATWGSRNVANLGDREAVLRAWKSLVHLLVDDYQWHMFTGTESREAQAGRDLLLWDFIVAKGCKAPSLDESNDLICATIDVLIAAGADVNASNEDSDGATALHQLCVEYAAVGTSLVNDSRAALLGHALFMLAFLRSRGADPTIDVDGQTSIDVLRQGLDLDDAEEDGQSADRTGLLAVLCKTVPEDNA